MRPKESRCKTKHNFKLCYCYQSKSETFFKPCCFCSSRRTQIIRYQRTQSPISLIFNMKKCCFIVVILWQCGTMGMSQYSVEIKLFQIEKESTTLHKDQSLCTTVPSSSSSLITMSYFPSIFITGFGKEDKKIHQDPLTSSFPVLCIYLRRYLAGADSPRHRWRSL